MGSRDTWAFFCILNREISFILWERKLAEKQVEFDQHFKTLPAPIMCHTKSLVSNENHKPKPFVWSTSKNLHWDYFIAVCIKYLLMISRKISHIFLFPWECSFSVLCVFPAWHGMGCGTLVAHINIPIIPLITFLFSKSNSVIS
jgi:hypothetical protein